MSTKQVGVAIGMAAALLITILAFAAVGAGAVPWPQQFGDSLWRWVAIACWIDGIWLFIAIAGIANFRFFSPADIDGAGLTTATEPLKVKQAILQNTLEQTLLACLAYAGVAAFTDSHWTTLLWVLPALFSIGRLTFALGYRAGAGARSFGFALTFYPTVGAYGLVAVAIVPQLMG
jgi:hypothetical protein